MKVEQPNPWDKEEDKILAEHYPDHGRDWDGWERLLPWRTKRAIGTRAFRIGLKYKKPERKSSPLPTKAVKREFEVVDEPDPFEPYVMRCMAKGMTPSEIDRERRWQRGTARLILTNKWAREQEDRVERLRRVK